MASHSGSLPLPSPEEVVARSARGAALTTVVGLLGRAAGLFTTLLVTHFVSKGDYGRANLALIIATLANLVTLLSPQQALLTRHQRFSAAARLVRGFAVWNGLLVAGLLLGGGGYLLGRLHEPTALPLLQVYALALVLERLSLVPALTLRYQLQFGALSRVDLGGDVAYVTVTVGGALLGAGAMCLPLGMVARQLCRVVVLGGWYKTPLLPPRPGPLSADTRALLREILQYSWPIHLGGLGEFLTMYLDNVVVGQLYSAAAQGLYAVGYTLVMTPSETIAMYGATAMVRALGLNDVATRQRTFLQGLRYVSLLLWPIGAGAALVAGTLEVALLPQSWRGIAGVVMGLGLGGAMLGVSRMCFAQLTALHRTRAGGLMYAVQLAAFGLGLFLVARLDQQRQHMPAVALAVSAAFTVPALLGLGLSIRADNLPGRGVLVALTPPLLGTAVMALAVWLLQRGLGSLGLAPSPLRLLIEITTGIAVYAAYLRLVHRALWIEATTWLAQRRHQSAPAA